MSAQTLLDPPRWRNGPPICIAVNLPAFETPKALSAFLEANSPHATIIHQWQCRECGQYHVWAYASPPAGASSGTTRIQKHIEAITARFWNSPVGKQIGMAR